MVYHLTFVYLDANEDAQFLHFCSESFHDVLDYLSTAYSGYQIVAFSCVRKCIKED